MKPIYINQNVSLESQIEYIGSETTNNCIQAILRYFQSYDQITEVALLTANNYHAFILFYNASSVAFVRTGFTSGYNGEGPKGLEYILKLISSFGIEIDEYTVPAKLLERINRAKLTLKDVKYLESLDPIRPIKYYEYIRNGSLFDENVKEWGRIPVCIPYAMIDSRIRDIVLDFNKDQDAALLKGYRRLETIIKERAGVDGNGVALFNKVFHFETGCFYWENLSKSEHEGRISQFTSCYKIFRNDRTHNENSNNENENILELIFLNNLFVLERNAQIKKP